MGSVIRWRQTARMAVFRDADRPGRAELVWVQSAGGPLIVVPESSVNAWGGVTKSGAVLGGPGGRDDYDRACEIDGLAGVITVGADDADAIVLADEPATTCFWQE